MEKEWEREKNSETAAQVVLSPLIQHVNDEEDGGWESKQDHEKDRWRGRGTGVERQDERIVRSE